MGYEVVMENRWDEKGSFLLISSPKPERIEIIDSTYFPSSIT
jgi:hypothetical protein